MVGLLPQLLQLREVEVLVAHKLSQILEVLQLFPMLLETHLHSSFSAEKHLCHREFRNAERSDLYSGLESTLASGFGSLRSPHSPTASSR